MKQVSERCSSKCSQDERDQKRMTVEDSDRLSDLPDHLLIEILSKLKTRQVVQTCVLSKRWHEIWTVVPSLDLDYHCEFSDHNRFENFVSTFLSIRDDAVNIDRFNLKYICGYPYDQIFQRLILYAVKHNPKIFRIDMSEFSREHNLLNILFVCGSLEEMKIDNSGISSHENLPNTIFLPKLRKLHLSGIGCTASSMEKLIAGCPSLESVSLKNCFRMHVKSISFPTLKRLSIKSWHDCTSTSTLVISGPCLEFLDLEYVYTGIILKDMSKVATAKISQTIFYSSELLSSLSGVEDLYLANARLGDTLKGELPKCPTFHNLKKVTLGRGCMYCDVHLWSSFVKHCPNLEQLILLHAKTAETCKIFKRESHTQEEVIRELKKVKSVGCDKLKLVNVANIFKRVGCDRASMEIQGMKVIFN